MEEEFNGLDFQYSRVKIYKQSIVLVFIVSPILECNLILLGLPEMPLKHGIDQVAKSPEK